MGRLLPFIILIIVLLSLLIGVPFLLHSDAQRAKLSDYLSQHLHHKVVVGKLSSGVFPPSLSLFDVAAFIEGQDSPFVRVQEVDAPLDWGNLFRGKTVPRALMFTQWVVTVHRRANGSWDWDQWLSPISQLSANTGWPLRKVVLRQGECHWVDPFASVSQELIAQAWEGEWNHGGSNARINGTISAGLVVPVTYTFEGKGQFFVSPQWSGDLRMAEEGRQWQVHLEQKPGTLDAAGQSAQWRWDIALGLAKLYGRWGGATATVSPGTFLGDWKTHLTVGSQQIDFHQLAGLSSGASEVTGQMTQRASDIVVRGKVALQNVPALALRETIDGLASWTGNMTGIAEFEDVVSSHTRAGAIHGNGYIEIKDGRYRFPPTSVKSLSKARTMAYLQKKYPDLEQKGLAFLKVGTHWRAANGFIFFDDALLNAGDLRAAMAGKIDPARHGMDGYARLQIHETKPALLKWVPGHYIYGAPGHEQIQPIYGHLQGSWDDWRLRAVPASKMPSSIQDKLRQALRQK